MKIKCLIVDDELEALEGLELLLKSDPEIEIVGKCSNGLDAIQSINEFKPKLLLLDIQMPGANGFEVLNNIKQPYPEIIFITAYDHFAIKAFEVHALDYLLKPFSDERFYEAIGHAKSKIKAAEPKTNGALDAAKEALKNEPINESSILTSNNKLAIKSDGKIHFVDKEKIKFVSAFDYYIKVHIDDHFLLVRESMKSILDKLGADFIRIHKSSIINKEKINSLAPLANNEMEVTLIDGFKLKVSRNYKVELIKAVS